MCVCTYILIHIRSVQVRLNQYIKSKCFNFKSPVCVWLKIIWFWTREWSTQNDLARKGFYKWPLPRHTVPSTELFWRNRYLCFTQRIRVYKHLPQHFPEHWEHIRRLTNAYYSSNLLMFTSFPLTQNQLKYSCIYIFIKMLR